MLPARSVMVFAKSVGMTVPVEQPVTVIEMTVPLVVSGEKEHPVAVPL